MMMSSDAGRQTFRPPESIVGTFGENLRKQREQRGLSLDAISTITKISPRMLRAIEEEHFDQLPGGVFNKGFVRAYARIVGLDEDEAVTDYLAALRENQVLSQTILPNFRPTKESREEDEPGHRKANAESGVTPLRNLDHRTNAPTGRIQNDRVTDPPSNRRLHLEDRRKDARRSEDREVQAHELKINEARTGEKPSNGAPPQRKSDDDVPSAPLSFLNLNSEPSTSTQSHRESESPASPDGLAHPVPWGKLAAALLLITLLLAFWTVRRQHRTSAAAQPAATPSAAGSRDSNPPAITDPAPASTKPSPTPAPARSASAGSTPAVSTLQSANRSPRPVAPANTSVAVSANTDVNSPVAKPHSHVVEPNPPHAFTLLIRADQTSWVSIFADGQPVAKETLIAPAHTSVRANHDITVRAGNAAGISFMLNGKEIPVNASPGEVRIFTFDESGLRSSAEPQPTNTIR
jgi:transcriptional regulator with XRE-family HTH domain